MLAAQKQIYKNCKIIDYLVIFFSVLMPFFCAIVEIFFSKNNKMISFTYIFAIIGMIVSLFIANHIEKLQVVAAKIQLLFDMEVYQLQWDSKLLGKKSNFTQTIAGKSKKILAKEKERKKILDWYPKEYDKLTIKRAIFFCQRANINWDSNIRILYKTFCCTLITIMVIIILASSILMDESLHIVLSKIIFIFPLMYWLSTKIVYINKDIRRLDELKDLFLDDSNRNDDELLQIQSYIYENRKNCTLIPDWFYSINRKKQENEMNMTAVIEIENNEQFHYNKDTNS
jgi:hypothetical protein